MQSEERSSSNKSHDLIIIGIAGSSGSGKSLLADTIVNEIGSDRVVVIREDFYYKDLSQLSLEQRNETNFDHPDAFDHALLIDHLKELKAGRSIETPVYDYTIHNRAKETMHVSKDNIIVVIEGILLFTEPELREQMDIRIFVDTPLDMCFIRRLQRDVIERDRTMESVVSQYRKTVRPMFIQFVEPSKRYADIIVPNGGRNRIAIEVIKSQMKAMLSKHPSKAIA